MTYANKRRGRRLRKKLHLGEFKEFGFEFVAKLRAPLPAKTKIFLADSFLAEIVEPRSLVLGCGIARGYICRFGHDSVTDVDREAIGTWLRARPDYKTR